MEESKAQKLAKALKDKEEGKVMDQQDKLAQREAVRLEKLAKKEAAAKKAALKNQAAEDVKKIESKPKAEHIPRAAENTPKPVAQPDQLPVTQPVTPEA